MEVQEESKFIIGQWVLTRATNLDVWDIDQFSHYNPTRQYKYRLFGGRKAMHCIAYNGNEELLGTSDMPKGEE